MPVRVRSLATTLAAAVVATAATGLAAPAPAVARPQAAPARLPVVPTTTGVLTSIDAGGATASPGWRVDDGYVGGSTSPQAPVTERPGEAPAAVAGTTRHGVSFRYTVRRLEPGTAYTLRLHFLEDYVTEPGARLVDVTVNGTQALERFDILAAAGGRNIPVHQDVPVVADAAGRLTIALTGARSEASLSGLQIIGRTPATRLGSHVKVSGIRAVATGPRTTVVRWRSTPGIAAYAVLRDGAVIGRTSEDAFVDGGATPGAQHRYSVAAVDPDGTLGIVAWGVTTRMPATTPRATGAFHTEGTQIIDPQGRPFVPVGANLGSHYHLDGAGKALGHAADATAWGWNAVRILVGIRWWDRDYLRALVREYRSAGLVVMIDAHEMWNAYDPEADTKAAQAKAFWEATAPDYKDDSGVWFNLANEPGYLNDDWFEFTAGLARTIRATGARNILVADAPGWGQDIGAHKNFFIGSRYGYSPTMAPSLQAEFGDVVLGQHNYGAKYDTVEKFAAYVDAVHANGVPLVDNEFGYADDGVSGAGSYWENLQGTRAVFTVAPAKGVGMLVWNGNVGDPMTLKQGRVAFYEGGPSANLSPMGRELWTLTH